MEPTRPVPLNSGALFRDPFSPASTVPWWRRNTWRVALSLVVVAVLVTAVVATQAFGQGNDLRVATATTRNVDSLQNGVATIEPVSQATVAFPVSGTVASVGVGVGNTVTAGQALASLDTQALTETLHAKQAALAQAQLVLAKGLSGQGSGPAPTTGSSGTGSGGTGSGGATLRSFRSTVGTSRVILTAATTGPTDADLSAAQQAVLDAQHNVDTATTTATNALNSAVSVCANVGTTSTPPPAPASTPTATATPTPSTPDPNLTACQTAIQSVLTAQTAVSTAQTTLANASTTLDNLLSQRLAAVPPAPPPTTPTTTPATTPTTAPATSTPAGGTGRTSGSSGSSGSGASNGSSGGFSRSTTATSSPSAADLVSYQTAVDAATDAVTTAQQAVAQATIASPIDGTVVAVNLAVGDSVTAASTTENVVVQGAGGYEVSTTVSVDNITGVAVGQHASVIPDGTHKALAGTVSSISVVPDPKSTSTSYLVVIGLADPNANLKNGSTGSVSIVTNAARSALAVPTSAITVTGNRHTVEVLDNGSSKRVTVQTGVVGDTWTEIKSGLTKGQTVVLADMAKPLPGSATSTSNSSQQTRVTGLPPGLARVFGGGGGFRGGGGGVTR